MSVLNDKIKASKIFLRELKDNINHEYLAKLFKDNNNDYIYSESLDQWFEYDEYNKLKGGSRKAPISLSYNITTTIQNLILVHKILLGNEMPKDKDGEKEHLSLIKFVIDLNNKVGDAQYIENIIKKLKYYCRVDKIEEKIDNNVNLISFNNVVFDFKLMKFRKIKRDDFIFYNVGYNKPEENKKIQERIQEIIYDMFDDNEEYKFLLDTLSLTLIGNINTKFYIWNGRGGNGKGLINALLMTALGEYYYQTSNTFLTSEHEGEKPNPNLYNLKGRRLAMISEPSGIKGKLKFNQSFIKLITSNNDKINARKLRENPITYTPLFTPFLQCNEIPELNNVGEAEIRRFNIINFKFIYKKEPKLKNEKKAQPEYSDLFKKESYGGQFLLMLINNLIELQKINTSWVDNKPKSIELTEPKSVIDNTKEYLSNCDSVSDWINENLVKVKDNRIKRSIIFNNFIKENPQSSKQIFNRKMKDMLFETIKSSGIWYYNNIGYRNEDDDINEKTKFLDV
jgi:phage/plasmid-associated DNA primase